MTKLDQYVNAATRDNTRKAYQGAVHQFEVEWGGFLPATAESVARYLVDHAETLSANTLRQRLAALAQWHLDQGFPDPTKAPIVRKVFEGVQVLHPAQEKRARPLQLEQLEQVDRWLEAAIEMAKASSDRGAELRLLRNRALLLLGFWRGSRNDELTRLRAEHVEVVPWPRHDLLFSAHQNRPEGQGNDFQGAGPCATLSGRGLSGMDRRDSDQSGSGFSEDRPLGACQRRRLAYRQSGTTIARHTRTQALFRRNFIAAIPCDAVLPPGPVRMAGMSKHSWNTSAGRMCIRRCAMSTAPIHSHDTVSMKCWRLMLRQLSAKLHRENGPTSVRPHELLFIVIRNAESDRQSPRLGQPHKS